MLVYSLRRLLSAIPTLLILITLAFFLVRVAPGGPFDSERSVPAEIQAKLDQKYHLDEPLWQQYGRYLGNVLQGDFGPSFQYQDFTVNQLIWGQCLSRLFDDARTASHCTAQTMSGFPVSMTIGALAMIVALALGILIGSIAALKQNSRTDHSIMAGAMVGISLPGFVVAPLLILLLAVYAGWLPAGGWNGAAPQNLVLPILTLALPQIAYIARLTRGSMIETLRSNFIRTAYAKGLSRRAILFRHALKPAMLPIVSYLGPATAGIITGSVVVESIFNLPGIGRYFVQGALNRDYTLVMGVVLFYGILIIAFNFLVDLLYAKLDPKVRHEYAK